MTALFLLRLIFNICWWLKSNGYICNCNLAQQFWRGLCLNKGLLSACPTNGTDNETISVAYACIIVWATRQIIQAEYELALSL